MPLRPLVIERLQQTGEWPPERSVIQMLMVSLYAECDDVAAWHTAVARALRVFRAKGADSLRRRRQVRWAQEQLDAGAAVVRRRTSIFSDSTRIANAIAK